MSKLQQWLLQRARRTPSPAMRWAILIGGLFFFEGILPMALIFAGIWRDGRLGLSVGTPSPLRIILGMVIALAGLTLLLSMIWMHDNEDQGTLSPLASPQRLLTHGPYAWVRNPMCLAGVVLLSFVWEGW